MTKLKRFSERMNIVTPKATIQTNGMDVELRTALWNVLCETYFHPNTNKHNQIAFAGTLGSLFKDLWVDFLNLPVTDMPSGWDRAISFLHNLFFSRDWNLVYEVVEYIANYDNPTFQIYINGCNRVFEKYLSGYRFLERTLTPITSEIELETIKTALEDTSKLQPINIHLNNALLRMSDRANPDFRNSIKESISAVEAICRIISGIPKATLGDGLNSIEKSGVIKIHGALKSGFSSIYGWTNDAQGIRHSLMELPTLTIDDAKFMLVSCSAFINYLITKSIQAGIALS